MFTINVQIRKENGKSASRRLRSINQFPAVIYGGNEAPVSVSIGLDSIKNLSLNPEFYSKAITLVIDGKETKVKVKSIQRHPFKPKLTHIDFMRV